MRQRLPHLAVFLVHGAFGGDKGDDAARTHLVQRFGDEIIVDQQVLAVVAFVMHLVAAKGDVAHRKVKEIVRVVGAFKAVHRNVCFLVKLLCNAPG